MNSYYNTGYITFAQNTDLVDYLQIAYLQAMNIRSIDQTALCTVIVDNHTHKLINDKHKFVFDHIILIDNDYNTEKSTWKLANECQIFDLTPYDYTVKVESDLWFTRSIKHWINLLDKRDIVLSMGCRTYKDSISTNRHYRKFFDDNNLPDIYNGIMMFQKTDPAKEFFELSKIIRKEWSTVSKQFKNCSETEPSTDVLYAITALIYGVERCTMPTVDFMNFVHMKPYVQPYTPGSAWFDMMMNEVDGNMLRINNLNQYHPVHYYEKEFVTDSLIEYYEQRIGIN